MLAGLLLLCLHCPRLPAVACTALCSVVSRSPTQSVWSSDGMDSGYPNRRATANSVCGAVTSWAVVILTDEHC